MASFNRAHGRVGHIFQGRYKKFVSEAKGQASPWALLRNQVYLGDEQFVEKMLSQIDGDTELSEIPSSQRRAMPKELSYYEASSPNRNSAINRAYRSGGYTLREIGDHFELLHIIRR